MAFGFTVSCDSESHDAHDLPIPEEIRKQSKISGQKYLRKLRGAIRLPAVAN